MAITTNPNRMRVQISVQHSPMLRPSSGREAI